LIVVVVSSAADVVVLSLSLSSLHALINNAEAPRTANASRNFPFIFPPIDYWSIYSCRF
jgi:hypothetical protein